MFAKTVQKTYICTSCHRQACRALRRQRRFQSTISNGVASPPPPPPPSGVAKLTTRRLISLHGPDAPKFLQGLITNNVKPESQAGFYAVFLTAPGKVIHDVFVYPTLGSKYHREVLAKDGKAAEDTGYLVEVDAEQVEHLMKHLKKHKLRSKFALRLLDEGELEVWSAWHEKERWTAHSQGNFDDQGTLGVTDCRAPGMGHRVLLPSSSSGRGVEPQSCAVLEGLEEAPLSAYTIRRYLRGVAEGQKELPREESLPMNSNIDIMGGIDFKKGCYLGQELTIRTHHTGVVRRRILPLEIYEHGQEPPDKLEYKTSLAYSPSGDDRDIKRDDKRRRATGKLIASVGNIGLGMCRLEQMSDLKISGEGSSFRPEDRFVVQGADGNDMAVKAFVPDWVRGRVREPKLQKRVE